jgi:hypothetical protein
MPTLRKPTSKHIGSTLGEEHSGLTLGMSSSNVQVTPVPQGPESLEFSRILEEVLSHLVTLETLQPYFGQARDPHSMFFGYLEKSGEAPLDYRSKPPAHTDTMGTRFFVRGRGKPKLYPLEDD